MSDAECVSSQVNNAATVRLKNCLNYNMEDYSTITTTNLESPYHLCQLSHPLLKASGNGSIVFISSIAGEVALPMISLYAATKGMLLPNSFRQLSLNSMLIGVNYRGNQPINKELGM